MDKEIENKINEILNKVVHYVLYEVREASGQFPHKIRFDLFFTKEDGTSHFMEREIGLNKDHLELAEQTYQEYVRQEILKEASNILKGLPGIE